MNLWLFLLTSIPSAIASAAAAVYLGSLAGMALFVDPVAAIAMAACALTMGGLALFFAAVAWCAAKDL